MKSSETDILVVPGYDGSGPDHWQSRMAAKLSTARIADQPDWGFASLEIAVDHLVAAVAKSSRPLVFVAHSAGTVLVAHAVRRIVHLNLAERIRGAFLVSVPSTTALAGLPGIDPAFALIPRQPLPFPSTIVASSNDPFGSLENSADMALTWGSRMIEAGEQGHINSASGHGPWPEGMMAFAGFLSRL
jgi:uncharacterized protein